MTAVAEHVVITEPGVYDIPDHVYHGDPVPAGSLSVSGAKKLLPPSSPAVYKHERENGQPHKRVFDIGHGAHFQVLGVGPELVILDYPDWRTGKAQVERDAAYAAGKVPLLEHEFVQVRDMATALRRHPRAADVLSGDGLPEQSLFWRDPDTGVWCRARPDWMTPDRIVDYKTCNEVTLEAISKTIYNFGYHQQADWYSGGASLLDVVAPDAPFYFVFQSKTPPYLVVVVELDEFALDAGRARNERARQIYAECMASGRWPGPADDQIELVSLPPFARRLEESL